MSKELAQELDPIEPEVEEEKPVEEAVVEEKPEVEPEAKEEEKEAEKPAKTVPLAALHEERERRKELQKQIQAQAERQRVIEERFQAIQQAAWQAQQPKPPEFETDPVGNLKHGIDATQAELAQIREYQAQQTQEFQRQQYIGQLQSTVAQSESQFITEKPDYLEAVGYLKTARAKQLEALGYEQGQIIAYVQNEAMQIADVALRNGRNPAEVAYNMAQASGWAPKAKETPAPQQKMEVLQKGTKAASSLGSGGNPTGNLTINAIGDMNDDEFHEFMKSGGWNKLG